MNSGLLRPLQPVSYVVNCKLALLQPLRPPYYVSASAATVLQPTASVEAANSVVLQGLQYL